MKRFISFLFIVTLSIFTLTGCSVEINSTSKEDVETLKAEIAELEEYKASLESEVEKMEDDLGLTTYVLTLSIKQNHFSLDIGDHMKDAMNELEFDIPVSKEFYESVDKGDVLDDSFRLGSFLMKGSFGSWKVKIKDKYIE